MPEEKGEVSNYCRINLYETTENSSDAAGFEGSVVCVCGGGGAGGISTADVFLCPVHSAVHRLWFVNGRIKFSEDNGGE